MYIEHLSYFFFSIKRARLAGSRIKKIYRTYYAFKYNVDINKDT